MWISDGWRDYALIDCGGGERLERWGKYYLVRPDPQALWRRSSDDPHWKKPDARYLRSSSGGGRWEKYTLPEQWTIHYKNLTFQVKPMNFKYTGIFPEQAANWDWTAEQIAGANRPVKVLNLFAYTGAATLSAAAAGASLCHVDAARGMVQWGRDNARLSNLTDRPIRWIIDDCLKFVEREKRRGSRYDGIIMDPPSFGRGPNGETWKIEAEIDGLIRSVAELLSDQPLFLMVNSYSSGLSPEAVAYMIRDIIERKFGGSTECAELGLPVAASGLALPCGATTRWLASERSSKQ